MERLILLAGLRAPESGIDCRVLGVIIVVSTFVSVASRLVFDSFSFRGADIACIVFATGQPTVLARTKEGHECREGCHGFWLFLAEVASEPFVADAMLDSRQFGSF